MKPVNMTVDYNIYKNLTFDFEPKMVQYIDNEVFHESWDTISNILNILYHKLYDEC
jgi:hypothetical protein